MSQANSVSVRNDALGLRYELVVDGAIVGEVRYRLEPGVVVLVHAEVIPEFAGRGLGDRLVAGVLEDIRARGLRPVPMCSFVASYLRRHPDDSDLGLQASAILE
jgi:predicted GNAT family acetyltransferase